MFFNSLCSCNHYRFLFYRVANCKLLILNLFRVSYLVIGFKLQNCFYKTSIYASTGSTIIIFLSFDPPDNPLSSPSSSSLSVLPTTPFQMPTAAALNSTSCPVSILTIICLFCSSPTDAYGPSKNACSRPACPVQFP
ncbi:hypothetical protein L1987_56055 [Smallanthus sonchifolius]|uniref:Uncharacterized protein n=1 Tax=Smallanthus sonchifolius TaxID=185202 RepID=A0ACB9ECS0_9ASTR|nr:hypothetical protein L1987_56055 [Smallanthus sonchifolius]